MSFNMEHGLDYIAYKRLPADSKEDLIDLSPDGDALLQDIWGTRFHHEFQTFSGRAV